MTSEQINTLVVQYLDECLEAGEEDRAMRDRITEAERETAVEGYSVGIDGASEALMDNDLSTVQEIADRLIKNSGITAIDRRNPTYRRLCRELLRAQITAYEIETDRWNGRYTNGAVHHPAGYRVNTHPPRGPRHHNPSASRSCSRRSWKSIVTSRSEHHDTMDRSERAWRSSSLSSAATNL